MSKLLTGTVYVYGGGHGNQSVLIQTQYDSLDKGADDVNSGRSAVLWVTPS